MAPRRRLPKDDPIEESTERSIIRSQQPTGAAARRSTSSSRVQDRRGEPLPNPIDAALGLDVDREAMDRYMHRQLTPAGALMMTPRSPLGKSTQLGRNYSTSMAANMDAYFNRLMAQPPSETAPSVTYEDGSTGPGRRQNTRYPEIDYSDVDKTQQQFRENQRQAMMRVMARRILGGGQPSTAQMLTQSWGAEGRPRDIADIADFPVDPIYGQQDRRQYPDGERYYEAGNINTMADALAERRDLEPSTLPPWLMAQQWNYGNRPFSPGVTQRYQPR